jgi:Family of unknown function (DUF5677)
LFDLATGLMQDASYSEDDHFAFMCLSYVSKQKTHIKSILALTESRDSGLIARAMLEGMCHLLWAAHDPTARALQWRAFAWILDWRLMQAQIKAGEPIDNSRRVTIEKVLQQYGDMFLTSKARKARRSGSSMPDDPYFKEWTGHSIREIIEEVGGQELYLKLYKSFSAWQHWSPAGLANAINRESGRILYSSGSPSDTATALAVGFQCLLQTLEVADKHLQLGGATKIAELRNDYIAWHQLQRTAPSNNSFNRSAR